MRVITTTDRRVDISGIDNHQLTGLRIVTAGGVIPTQRGDVIGIFHQYASVPQGRSIHSCVKLESFGIRVYDRSKLLGGKQALVTPEGYVMPLDFENGLPYLPMRPYTDTEWRTLPHVVFTSDVDWDPSSVDCKTSDDTTSLHGSTPYRTKSTTRNSLMSMTNSANIARPLLSMYILFGPSS